MPTKKQNKRGKVRHLRRVLNRSTEPVHGFHARRLYNAGHGDGRVDLPRDLDSFVREAEDRQFDGSVGLHFRLACYKNVPARLTGEFRHYDGCRHRDPDNCSGCALTTGGPEGPNYSAWPLVYIENHTIIPAKWREALKAQLQSDNKAYADNIRAQIEKHGIAFSDGKGI